MSTTPDGIGTTAAAPAADVLGVLHDTNARLLEREGIAMFVAVDDLRPGRHLEPSEREVRDDGARLAALFDHYHAGLAAAGFPSLDPDPDETGSRELIDVLVVLSDQHLRARVGA